MKCTIIITIYFFLYFMLSGILYGAEKIKLNESKQLVKIKYLNYKSKHQGKIKAAIKVGNLEELKKLIEAGSEFSMQDFENAARYGHLHIVKYFLELTPQVSAYFLKSKGVLYYAIQYNKFNIVKYLVEKKIAVDEPSYPPLQVACRSGHLEIVKYLISKGAAVNKKTNRLYGTPLNDAVIKGHLHIVTFLLKDGADVNLPGYRLNTPLHLAAQFGHFKIVKLLIQKGAIPDSRNKYQRSPLFFSSRNGYSEISNYLKKKGARLSMYEQRIILKYERKSRKESVNTFLAFSFTAAYIGTSVYFREKYYKDDLENNNMATFNGITSGTVVGAVGIGLLGAVIWPRGSGMFGGLNKLTGLFLGGIIGGVAGGYLGYRYRDNFKTNRGLYYSVPAFSIIIPIMVYKF